MPHINATRCKPAAAAKRATLAVLVLLLACLGLAACGNSSSSSSTTTTTSANAAATAGGGTGTGPTGPGGGRFKALRECLQKNGITLAKRTPGQSPPARGGPLGSGGGPKLPAGVTRAQYEAAFKKCGGSLAGPGGGARFSSPRFSMLSKAGTAVVEAIPTRLLSSS